MGAEKSRTTTLYVALQSTGILELLFDPKEKDANQALSVISTFSDAGKMPGWLASQGDKIYSISRLHYPDESFEDGGCLRFSGPRFLITQRRRRRRRRQEWGLL